VAAGRLLNATLPLKFCVLYASSAFGPVKSVLHISACGVELDNRPARAYIYRFVDNSERSLLELSLESTATEIQEDDVQNALNNVLVERRSCDHLCPACRSRPVHGSSSILVLSCNIENLRSFILRCITFGASIDERDLFLLFRLGRKPAKPITLLGRRLCPGRLHW
jgi:hypothetical protein